MGHTQMCARCGEGWGSLDHYDGSMPYHIEQRGSQHCVIKDATGERMGCHASPDAAKSQLSALYANEDISEAEILATSLMSLDL